MQKSVPIAVGFLILVTLALIALKLYSTPRWEYHCEAVRDASLELGMSNLGEKGWELVSARRATDPGDKNKPVYEMIFKRRKR